MGSQIFVLEQVCREDSEKRSLLETHQGVLFNIIPSAPTSVTKPGLHDVLRYLVTSLASPQSLDVLLRSVTTLTVRSLGIDLCALLLSDQSRQRLSLQTWAPDFDEMHVSVQPVYIDDALLERLQHDLQSGHLSTLSADEQEALNPLKNVLYQTLLPIPLIAGNECLGMLLCYSSKNTSYTDDEQLMLTAIANQSALAIKNRQVLESEMQTRKDLISGFLDDLFANGTDSDALLLQRAHTLGCNLQRPHLVAMIQIAQDGQRDFTEEKWLALQRAVRGQIKTALLQRYTDSLVDERSNVLRCLLHLRENASAADIDTWMSQFLHLIQREQQVLLTAGISSICRIVTDYSRGYAEAREALEIGQCLHPEGGCTRFESLGVYRYIYKFARTDTLRDQYQCQIASLAEYDQRKKTNLLDTLEIYLESGGNITKTSSLLNVHRNTLLQRLDRIQLHCNFSLEDHTHWLPLLVALKVYKLREPTST